MSSTKQINNAAVVAYFYICDNRDVPKLEFKFN